MVDIDPTLLPAFRRWARAKARYACGGLTGRGKLDRVYVGVTQGRDYRANWTHYSSCGDLLHWLAAECGVPPETHWLNRDFPEIGKHWQFVTDANGGRDNISMLWAYGGPAINCPAGYLPEPGDFLLCWHDDMSGVHVRVAGNTEGGIVETFDYGAGGMSASEFPGASCNHLKLVTDGSSRLMLETLPGARTHAIKRIQKVVPFAKIVALAGDRRPSLTGEEIDALEQAIA